MTLAGPDGEVVASGREPAVGRRPPDLTCRATHPAHSRTWHVALDGAADGQPSARPRAVSSGIASSVAVSEPW